MLTLLLLRHAKSSWSDAALDDRDWPGPERVLLLVGHNPSLEGLAKLLAARGDHAVLAKLTAKYPTGALAVIGLEPPSWTALHAGAGTLLRFIRPRDIMAGADG
jgi:phosphohistidine phosphatase